MIGCATLQVIDGPHFCLLHGVVTFISGTCGCWLPTLKLRPPAWQDVHKDGSAAYP